MARVFALKDARSLGLPGRHSREILGAASGAAGSTLRIVEIEPQQPGAAKRGPHAHSDFEECIHVLSGEGITCTDQGEYPIAAGDTVLVPAKERHATYNTGTTVLRLLCFFPTNDVSSATKGYESWETPDGAR
ncbi:MAG: cupin domain-containing protein [Burkholderiales bacterium]